MSKQTNQSARKRATELSKQTNESAEQMLLKQAAMRMVQRLVSMAFGTWRSMAAEQKRVHHVCGAIIRRMQNQKLSAAFEKWQATLNKDIKKFMNIAKKGGTHDSHDPSSDIFAELVRTFHEASTNLESASQMFKQHQCVSIE